MNNSTTSLTVFQFNPDMPLRSFLDEKGDPWFIGGDACKTLGYANTAKAISDNVDEEDRGYIMLTGVVIPPITHSYTPGSTLVINESGLFALILRSTKPEAKAFKRYVTSEVLPALRKTGQYAIRQMSPLEILKQQVELMEGLERRQAESERRIERLETTFEADQGHPQMMTIRAYATYRGLRLSDSELSVKGRAATRYSNMHGFPIETTAHRTYGRINLYHIEVLQEIFKQHGMFERQ